ncbi:MAG: hypothetical protein Q4G03_05515, partial [Planctomycetia bacterium]|nr:hypothetical protein [Planctomycetia bacterium]
MKINKRHIAVACVLALLTIGIVHAHLGVTQMKAASVEQEERDAIEAKLFGRAISVERNGQFRIGVKCRGGIYADLTVYCAKDGRYEKLFTCPAVIGRDGYGLAMEGIARTPLGTFKVGKAYGIKEDPGSKIPYAQITEDMYWCGDSKSPKYNTLVYHSDNPEADHSEDEHL